MVNLLSGNRLTFATTFKAHSLVGSKRAAFCSEQIGRTRLHASRRENSYFKLEEVLWRGREEDALEPDSLPRQLAAPWKVSNECWFDNNHTDVQLPLKSIWISMLYIYHV